MRIYFELEGSAPMVFKHNGAEYPFKKLTPLAKKVRLATNIHEYVYQLPTGEYIYATVVGDEDQTDALGIRKGWYLIESISEEEAMLDIDTLSKFTVLYE